MGRVSITQVRSRIGATHVQCKNLDALGLRRMGRTVEHEESATIKGMIEKVKHLVRVETVVAKAAKSPRSASVKTQGEAGEPKPVSVVAPVEVAEKPKAAPKPKAPAKPRAKKTE